MAKLESIEPDGNVQQSTHPPSMTPALQHQNQPEFQSADYSVPVVDPVTMTSESLAVGIPWTTGLFDCHEDPKSAVIAAYLPCMTFGQIAEVLDAGELNCALGGYIYLVMMPALCTHWLMGSKYRAKLRRNYNLVEAPHSDIVTHIVCPCCALAQEFRELKNRGLDPSLGWKGIIAQDQGRLNSSTEMNVPPSQGMSRFQ